MKLKGAHTAPITATEAAAPSFVHEDLLDTPPTVSDVLLPAEFAATGAARIESEADQAVLWAGAIRKEGSRRRIDVASPAIGPGDLPLPKPVADGRYRPIKGRGNLQERGPATGERFKELAIWRPLGGERRRLG
jgi:hypothetical protein